MNMKRTHQKRHIASQYLDDLLSSRCQFRFTRLICLPRSAFLYIGNCQFILYFDMIFIATFSPVFLLVAFLTTAKLPLLNVSKLAFLY